MRRFIFSMCLLMVMASLSGCATKLGCRDCGGLLGSVKGRSGALLARTGGCSTGACRSGLFAPATGFGNTGGCGAGGNGLCGHNAAEPPAGPPTGQYAYPYYTLRGPRDFLQSNPPSIGP